MYDTTPNLDRMAKDGMRFTDYYAGASCTAGRVNFITGDLKEKVEVAIAAAKGNGD